MRLTRSLAALALFALAALAPPPARADVPWTKMFMASGGASFTSQTGTSPNVTWTTVSQGWTETYNSVDESFWPYAWYDAWGGESPMTSQVSCSGGPSGPDGTAHAGSSGDFYCRLTYTATEYYQHEQIGTDENGDPVFADVYNPSDSDPEPSYSNYSVTWTANVAVTGSSYEHNGGTMIANRNVITKIDGATLSTKTVTENPAAVYETDSGFYDDPGHPDELRIDKTFTVTFNTHSIEGDVSFACLNDNGGMLQAGGSGTVTLTWSGLSDPVGS